MFFVTLMAVKRNHSTVRPDYHFFVESDCMNAVKIWDYVNDLQRNLDGWDINVNVGMEKGCLGTVHIGFGWTWFIQGHLNTTSSKKQARIKTAEMVIEWLKVRWESMIESQLEECKYVK